MTLVKNYKTKEYGAAFIETIIALPVIFTIGFFSLGIVDYTRDLEQSYTESRKSIINSYRQCALTEDWHACNQQAKQNYPYLSSSIKSTLYEVTNKGLESLSNGKIVPVNSLFQIAPSNNINTENSFKAGSRIMIIEDQNNSQLNQILPFSYKRTLKHSAVLLGATSAWDDKSRGFSTQDDENSVYTSGLSALEMWDANSGKHLGNLSDKSTVNLANKRVNFRPVLKTNSQSSTVFINGTPLPITSSNGFTYKADRTPTLPKGNHTIRVITYSKSGLRGMLAHRDISFKVI